jgi:hypothetical protein
MQRGQQIHLREGDEGQHPARASVTAAAEMDEWEQVAFTASAPIPLVQPPQVVWRQRVCSAFVLPCTSGTHRPHTAPNQDRLVYRDGSPIPHTCSSNCEPSTADGRAAVGRRGNCNHPGQPPPTTPAPLPAKPLELLQTDLFLQRDSLTFFGFFIILYPVQLRLDGRVESLHRHAGVAVQRCPEYRTDAALANFRAFNHRWPGQRKLPQLEKPKLPMRRVCGT